jgi:hypothetical protein
MTLPHVPPYLDHEFLAQPAVRDWMEANHDRAAALAPLEVDELVSLFGTGGPLTPDGVSFYVREIERKRAVRAAFEAVISTHLIDLVEPLMLHFLESVRPKAPNSEEFVGRRDVDRDGNPIDPRNPFADPS